ncbi:MaoC/PaaZ C-terminal domain-containing protein [Halopelagius fulvigenes]|uniref:MaoC/PaaZ C-terminal domain-containing protein n=1 Tax=Halopelagius fulvigenes TaxID=1198324 RepID=A0ABD5U453_9EURY
MTCNPPTEGDAHAFERTFTAAEVRRFAELSGDTQPRHTEPDDDGRVLVHGLLTATMPTKIGGELGVLAREMTFEFVEPVYAGTTVTCTCTVADVTERDDRYELVVEVRSEDEGGETVMTGEIAGLVWKERRR